MSMIKKNILTLFYIILLISFIVVSSLVYKLTLDTYEEYISDQISYTKISATSIHSVFIQYEAILDVLGQLLTKNENYKSLEISRKILDEILKLNPAIAAFGLAKPDGQLYTTSSNLKNIKKLANLAKKEETKNSFRNTLEKDSMVLGRTYYHKTLKTLIIPIRKVIKDKNDNIIAVMTAGINVNKSFNFLGETSHDVFAFRNFDNFYQLTDSKHSNNIYKAPLPKKFTSYIFKKLEEKYKIPLSDIQKSEMIVTIFYEHIKKKHKVLTTSKFLDRYELWVLTQINENLIIEEILKKSGFLIILFILTMIVLYILFKNIEKNEENKKKALYFQATHDHLTKLHNRLFLSNEFEKVEEHKPFSLFFIDMDNFKNINDNYGHNYGDKILKEIALRLSTFKVKNDALIRYSGDEFLLITYRTQKEKIKKLAIKIINRLSEPYLINQYKFILGSSIGIAQYPFDGKNFDEIKRYADIAMYEAKKEKNTFRIFEDTIKHKYLKTSKIEEELKTAIENNEIYMIYQPQLDTKGKLYGVEALVRWENKNLGFVPPDEFIKIAEDTGLMLKLGEYIIKTSLQEIKNIQKLTNKHFQLSINISIKQFMDERFYEKFLKSIEKINFDNLLITLEMTENIFIEDLKYILNLLYKLKEVNIKISLDDFGTGYSSLSLLKKLPIDELKIDKSFVDDILIDEASKNMINSIISIGKKFKMTILAEGIETKEQKELLDEYECDLFQGYYFSKPLKKEDLLEFIKKNK